MASVVSNLASQWREGVFMIKSLLHHQRNRIEVFLNGRRVDIFPSGCFVSQDGELQSFDRIGQIVR